MWQSVSVHHSAISAVDINPQVVTTVKTTAQEEGKQTHGVTTQLDKWRRNTYGEGMAKEYYIQATLLQSNIQDSQL